MASFSLDLSRWCAKAKDKADLVIRKVSLDMFRRIVLRSPVDTGRFRGNWQVAIGKVPQGTLEVEDKSGAVTISAGDATILGVKAGDVIYMVNNLPYANRLEHGWSKQAPAGMVGITVAEFQGLVDKAAGEVKEA